MALIDDRGRLFGKINLIDFGLLVFVLLLVPLGYGAYLLFRTPRSQLLGVSPNPLIFKRGEQRVRIAGEHLRPFLRATIGRSDARGFLIESPTSAEIVFDEMQPGTYDLALFDQSEEIARMPNALTITPPPAPPIQLVGRFVGANAANANLAAGAMIGDPARSAVEVVEINPAVKGERAATLRSPCDASAGPCLVAGSPIVIGKPIALRVQGRDDALTFVVDQIRADGVWRDVHVRLMGIAEALELIRVGDIDRFTDLEASTDSVTRGAVVRSLGPIQSAPGGVALSFSQALGDSSPFNGNLSGSGQLELKTRMAVLRVPLKKTERGWRYRDEFIRPGSGLALETTDYFVRGLILRVVMPHAAPRDRTGQ